MVEKINLQQEALNALTDAALSSEKPGQAFIKGYCSHAYRQSSQEEEHAAAITMTKGIRSAFSLEEFSEDDLVSKCACIYRDIQTSLHDAYDRFKAEDERQLVEITDYIGRNCHELEGCAVIFTWKGETKAGTLQYNGMSDLSIRGLDYDTDYVLEVWPDGSVHSVNKNIYDLHVFAGKRDNR
ncbi:hypothetical protein [Bifidobacterium breve]|uniref:hypothetical protein n=1 Tax=Bifidobacterium breve TaxID=1685 RepID=UPI00254EC132|nr:hypothetical protein [Bifidobacterium breve]MDK8732431.1 hypothetical protein [Bifidobacterium breve]